MACTVWPAATSAGHSLRPTNPDEPATRSFTAGIPSVKWPRSAAHRLHGGDGGFSVLGRSAPFLDPVLGPVASRGAAARPVDLRRRGAVPGVGAFGLGQLSRGATSAGSGNVVAVLAFLAGQGCSTASRR